MDDQNKAHLQTMENEVEEVHADSDIDSTEENISSKKPDPRDSLTPDHPRFKEVYDNLKEEKEKRQTLEEELRELRTLVQSQNNKQDEEVYTEDEERALERIDKGLRKRGYLTKSEVDELNRTQQRAQAMKDLESEYNGSNGYPKFDAVEVMAHAKREGISNLKTAYRDLHYNAILRVEAKRGVGVDTVDSERPTGGDRNLIADLDPANIENMSDDEWNKKGASIMDKFKKAVYGK